MAERSRKRKTERASSINKQPKEQQYDFNAARSDDGFNDEYPDGEYAMKRQRNNAAVNKTREKKRQEEFDTVKRVKQLRDENAALEKTVESLRHELGLLKEMVLSFASSRSKNDQANGSSNGRNAAGSSR